MQHPPPPQGYPPPQQGYQQNAPIHPPQQNYPPPQQGYPPPAQQGYQHPQQGYPPPQQGYPPPQQGYQANAAPPQQGYPPPQPGQAPPPPQHGYQQNALPSAPPQQGYPPPQQGYQPNAAPPQQGPPPTHQGQVPPQHPPQGAGNVDLPGGADDKAENEIGDEDKSDVPISSMVAVTGYDVMNSMIPPPPTYEEAVQPPPPDFSAQMPVVKDDEAREALLSHVAEKCCWGKKAAEELNFTNINQSAAFHYVLETFSEKRTTNWASEPYVGQAIDSPNNGPAPLPWSIAVQNPPMFQDTVTYLEVPHTATVKPCHDCRASGYRRCHNCYGRGTTRCFHCDGRGTRAVSRYDGDHHYTDYEHCSWCGGDGRRTPQRYKDQLLPMMQVVPFGVFSVWTIKWRSMVWTNGNDTGCGLACMNIKCSRCCGSGRIVCVTCDANGQLKCYIRLTVEWKNHVADHIVERTNLPDELIRDVTGQQVFQEEHPKVWAIQGFPVNDVNTGSSMLVKRHAMAYNKERLHRQRHQIRVIPVAEAKCSYKDETFTFFVYGFERKVYAPEYPMQCCWGCSIL